MDRRQWVLAGAGILLVVIVGLGVRGQSGSARVTAAAASPEPAVSAARVLQPSVAGTFYPDDPEALGAMVDGFVAQARPEPAANLRGLVCPHAGYVYSGPVAGFCYRLVAAHPAETVAILAPSHRARFEGVAIPDVDAMRTPLGLVALSDRAARLAATSPFVFNAAAYSREHALEVQLPFLQRTAPSARILPMLFGEVDEVALGQRLDRDLPEGALVVVSSDLSHYHPYEEARQLDRGTIEAILALDVARLQQAELCGKGPVTALITLARIRGWEARLLDYRNSGDTAGDRSRVVGYAAMAFYATGARRE
jgi:hypothetical protein